MASYSAWSGKEHTTNVSKSQKLSQASSEHTGVLLEARAKALEETPFLTEEKALTARLVEAGLQASLPSALHRKGRAGKR